MQRKRKVGDDSSVKELPEKKRGRPLLLGDKLDGQVKSYIGYLREKGAAVNTAIVVGIAQGIVKSHNGNLLACNGGHLVLGKPWAKSFLSHMGYVKRRGSTAAKVTVENFQQLREQFLIDIKAIVEVEEIPTDLISIGIKQGSITCPPIHGLWKKKAPKGWRSLLQIIDGR